MDNSTFNDGINPLPTIESSAKVPRVLPGYRLSSLNLSCLDTLLLTLYHLYHIAFAILPLRLVHAWRVCSGWRTNHPSSQSPERRRAMSTGLDLFEPLLPRRIKRTQMPTLKRLLPSLDVGRMLFRERVVTTRVSGCCKGSWV
jgi:hypothetical protein